MLMKHTAIFSFVLLLLFGAASLTSCDKEEDAGLSGPGGSAQVDNNGHDYVDLGLSVLWATRNIGASSSTDPGDKYAFDETTVKSEYTSSNYVGGEGDVAALRWGGEWRLPTKSELSELVFGCSWKINTKDGVEVITATGPNGRSIDFPYYSYIGSEGLAGWYWSSTPYTSTKAYCLHFEGSEISYGTNNRYNGFLARAVIPNPDYHGGSGGNGGEDDPDSGSGGSYEKPDVGFYDFTATRSSLKVQYKIYNKEEAGLTSARIYYGTSSNPTASKSATVSGVLITANITGLKAGTTYYVKCVATGKGGTTTTEVTKCITNY